MKAVKSSNLVDFIALVVYLHVDSFIVKDSVDSQG